MSKRFIIICVISLSWFFFPSLLTANEPTQSKVCRNIQSAEQIIDCVVDNRVDILKSQAAVNTTQLLQQKVSQHPNPEIEVESHTTGRSRDRSFALSASLLQPIIRGNKLEARSAVALAQHQLAKADLNLQKFAIRQGLIREFYTILSLTEEMGKLDEMIGSYKRIIRLYRDRLALAPSARISVDVFKLALVEAEIELREKQDELASIQNTFIQLGAPQDKITKFYPKSWPAWPTPSDLQKSENTTNPYTASMRAEVDLAQKELELEKSESFQNVHIGPMVSFDTTENISNWGVGVGFSMDLPLYNQNEAGIKYGLEKLATQKAITAQFENQAELQLELLILRYQNLHSKIATLPASSWLEASHRKLESEAKKGVIEASLIIEGHEQSVKIEERRNDFQLRLLTVLTEIYALKGYDIGDLI